MRHLVGVGALRHRRIHRHLQSIDRQHSDQYLVVTTVSDRDAIVAVDSTVCPEIEQDDLSSQVYQPQRPVACVNPQIRREFRRSDGGSFLKVSWHGVLLLC